MSQPALQDAAWYRATTLEERVALRRTRDRSSQFEEREAERFLSRWRSQPPFTNPLLFQERLSLDGISKDEFLGVLGEPVDSLYNSCSSVAPWLIELSQAFSRDPPPKAPRFPEGIPEQLAGMLNAVEPLVADSLAQLRKGVSQVIRAHPQSPIDSETIERIFFADLPQQLLAMVGRTMVLELNVARLEGRLVGDTPEDRFHSFFERLCRPVEALAMLREYPVLARQLTVRLDQWVACSLEFIERLCRDWDLIRHIFSPDEDPGVLVQVRTNAGDRHREGRTVSIAKFGSGLRLAYQPKSMAVDAHFQELLAWANQRGSHSPFRTSRILNRETHGWGEFVAAETCDSLPALRRFYERLGGYLALLYVLEATDFHCENLMAAGEHPVLIDLEAIFQPRLPTQQEGEDAGSQVFEESVLCVGLLPQRNWSNANSAGVDISGLGGAAGQITPFAVPDWENAGTDEMRLTRKPMTLPAAQNRPTLNGADADPCDYCEEIAAGFTSVYCLVLKHRDELMSSDGPLAQFAPDEVRAILRPTRTYHVLLDESFHPDVLRNGLDRDLLFDRLWAAAESRPYLAKVILAERHDLERGDIPLFTARPASRDIWTSSNTRIRDFFDESGLALVQRRLRQLSERDLDLQLWTIRASLGTTVTAHSDGKARSTSKSDGSRRSVGREEFLRAAKAVGDRLESLAIRGNQTISWVGLMLVDEDRWSISTLTGDFYDGLPGVTLFLAYLGAISGEPRYSALAQEACATMLRGMEKSQSTVTAIGAFDGWGGIIYSLSHLAALWRAPELLARAESVVGLLPARIEQDEQFDIIAGAAGCIGALLALYDQTQSQRALSVAIQCGEHLIARAGRTDYGVGWILPTQSVPLSGFAHGAAGIAWSLLKLATLSGDARFHTTALAAIAHERSLFSPQAGNWWDLRAGGANDSSSNGNAEPFMTAWCNGCPGIGLARLSTIKLLDDLEVRREIITALNTTIHQGFGRNHSLCHGDLGNVELLLQAGQVLNQQQWQAEAYRLASPVVESVGRNEYRCGTPLNVDSPGLMTGLAGIGYGLLRLAEPGQVPSVLTLEPPLRD